MVVIYVEKRSILSVSWMERQTASLFFKNQDFQNKLSGSFEVQEKKIKKLGILQYTETMSL